MVPTCRLALSLYVVVVGNWSHCPGAENRRAESVFRLVSVLRGDWNQSEVHGRDLKD